MSERITDWRRVAARMRAELERADLNERARALAAWCIRPTLLRGRVRVTIPNLAAVAAVLGIGKNHMAAVVAELASTGVASFKDVAEGWELLVFPDPSRWCVRWKWDRAAMDSLLRIIDAHPGQCHGELLEPEPCLAWALAETAAETARREDGRWKMEGGVVPKMGTERVGCVNSKPVTVHSVTAIKQLNSEQLTGSGGGRKPGVQTADGAARPALPLSREREAEAMDKLRRLVGEADVEQWGGDWRKNWLRRYPREFLAALETLLEESATGWQAKRSPGAALKDLTRRYAGQRDAGPNAKLSQPALKSK